MAEGQDREFDKVAHKGQAELEHAVTEAQGKNGDGNMGRPVVLSLLATSDTGE